MHIITPHYTFYSLLITFSVFGILLFANLKEVSWPFRKVSRTSWIMLLLILVVVFYLYLSSGYCASHDRMLWEYAFSADGMLRGHVDLMHPKGYSFILLMLFSVFGENCSGILILSALIPSLTTIVVFLITYYIFRREEAAVLDFLGKISFFLSIILSLSSSNFPPMSPLIPLMGGINISSPSVRLPS